VKFTPRGNVHPFVHTQGSTLSTILKNGGANREFHPKQKTSPLGVKIQSFDADAAVTDSSNVMICSMKY
jgi:hypothetical protein